MSSTPIFASGEPRPHEVGHHVHRPAPHRAVEEAAELAVGVLGGHPVVVRSGFLARRRTDEREVLDARDVARMGAMEVAARELLRIQRDQDALLDGVRREALLLLLGPVAPHDGVGLREAGAFLDPGEKMGILREGVPQRGGRQNSAHRCSFRRASAGGEGALDTATPVLYGWGDAFEPAALLPAPAVPVSEEIRSLAVGALARLPLALRPASVLGRFAAAFGANLEEADRPLEEYASVLDFFTRRLRPAEAPGARRSGRDQLPVDGRSSRPAAWPTDVPAGQGPAVPAGRAPRR